MRGCGRNEEIIFEQKLYNYHKLNYYVGNIYRD